MHGCHAAVRDIDARDLNACLRWWTWLKEVFVQTGWLRLYVAIKWDGSVCAALLLLYTRNSSSVIRWKQKNTHKPSTYCYQIKIEYLALYSFTLKLYNWKCFAKTVPLLYIAIPIRQKLQPHQRTRTCHPQIHQLLKVNKSNGAIIILLFKTIVLLLLS